MSNQRDNYYYNDSYYNDERQDGDYPAFNRGRGAPNRRGARSNPRQNYKPRTKGGSNNSFKKPPPDKVLDEVPKPQRLSRTASVEKIDPLCSESFFTDESQALAPEPDLREIFSGLEGLDLVSESIHSFCT